MSNDGNFVRCYLHRSTAWLSLLPAALREVQCHPGGLTLCGEGYMTKLLRTL